jgi:peptide/nickel transport system substrate-binding protein
MPLATDLAKAKALLTEAGFPNGFSTTFAYSAGLAATSEPMAALLKESLGKIGIAVELQKMPDAQFNTMEADKKLPFYTDGATAWLPFTDYYFRLYFTRDQRWNFSSLNDAEMNKLTTDSQFELDSAKYEAECKRMIAILAEEVPLLMMWQPNHDAVMAKSVDGYTYWFYRQIDFRDLTRV